MKLNPALRDFWKPRKRNRVLYGGRASSKTWDAGGMAVWLASNYKARFLCTRQFQNKISESVYTLIKSRIESFGLSSQFLILESSIRNLMTGSEFVFYGRARNIEEIKGLEGIDIHWAEECELLTAEQWRIIDPTLRKDGSQHWLIFNPKFASDFVYQRFVVNPPADTIVRKINYDENPFLSDTMRRVIESMRLEDEDEYRHVYLGEPLSDDDRVIIKTSWIEAAIDAHIKLNFKAEGRRVIGFDVADGGDDKCANVFMHGSVVEWSDEWKAGEDELLKSCSHTYDAAVRFNAEIGYDCIGVGAMAGAKFGELNEARSRNVDYFKFDAGAGVVNPDAEYAPDRTNADHFSNLKAQTWWTVADRFRNTFNAVTRGHVYPVDQMISISSDCPNLEKLKAELATPRRDFDLNGRVKVESKKDLKTRGVASPNVADALIIAAAPQEIRPRGFFD